MYLFIIHLADYEQGWRSQVPYWSPHRAWIVPGVRSTLARQGNAKPVCTVFSDIIS